MEEKAAKGLISGAKWGLLSNWYARIIGTVNTLILLRLLEPKDFGIVALATFFVSLYVAFSAVGVSKYVISKDNLSNDELNSIWSLGLTMKILSAILLFISAPFIGQYLNNIEIVLVIQVTSVIPIISGFRNVGLDLMEKKYNFKLLILINIFAKTIGTVVSITLAIYYKSYWALIVGVITIASIEQVLSYIYCSYRPRFTSSHWRKQWLFSKWVYLTSITGYFRSRIDVLILGNIIDTKSVGVYSISQEFAWLPYNEIVSPMNRGVYAVFSNLKNDIKAFNDRVIKQLSYTLIIIVPCAFGVAAISTPFTFVILGEKWLAADVVIRNIAGLMIVMAVYELLVSVLIIKERMKVLILMDVVVVITIISSFYISTVRTIEYLSELRMIIGAGFFVVIMSVFYMLTNIKLHKLLSLLILPFVSSIIMYIVVTYSIGFFDVNFIKMLTGVPIGIATYGVLIIFLSYLVKEINNTYWELCVASFNILKKALNN
ncbi:oligosaccharide flippase family protein [Photobacterium minamisatsumaniensis]|uniref:oligosaccharide flippase family protein n=1 Tax=Photobacterium minamisatsumaniensis TaxID=2910233 RepID=UPI003D110FF9